MRNLYSKHVLLQSSVPAGSLSYLEALTRGRQSELQRAEVQPTPSSSSSQPSSEEQLLLLGQGLTSRLDDGGGRGRGQSASFSLASSARSAPSASPPN